MQTNPVDVSATMHAAMRETLNALQGLDMAPKRDPKETFIRWASAHPNVFDTAQQDDGSFQDPTTDACWFVWSAWAETAAKLQACTDPPADKQPTIGDPPPATIPLFNRFSEWTKGYLLCHGFKIDLSLNAGKRFKDPATAAIYYCWKYWTEAGEKVRSINAIPELKVTHMGVTDFEGGAARIVIDFIDRPAMEKAWARLFDVPAPRANIPPNRPATPAESVEYWQNIAKREETRSNAMRQAIGECEHIDRAHDPRAASASILKRVVYLLGPTVAIEIEKLRERQAAKEQPPAA